VQGVCDVVGDPFSGFLKAKSVWCKCTNKIKETILERKKVGSTTKIKPS
jgi:hypothetical protein